MLLPKLNVLVCTLLMLAGFAQATDANELLVAVKACPGVDDARVVVDQSHIGITIRPQSYATSEDLEKTIAMLVADYGYLINATPGYLGSLRIGLAARSNGQIVAIWEAYPERTRQNYDTTTGSILLSYVNEVIANGKYLTYSDGYGDVTKTVDGQGSRLSASVGNWL